MKRLLTILLPLALLVGLMPTEAAAQKTINLDWASTATGSEVFSTTSTMTASTSDTSEPFTITWFGDNDSTCVLELWSNDDTTKALIQVQQLVYDPNTEAYRPSLVSSVYAGDSLTSGWHTGALKNPVRLNFRYAIPGVGTYRVIVTNGTGVGVDSDNADDLTAPTIDGQVKFLK